ncbi:AcvB/VirJ family lysyl-phosphatidylglycerol hydrolase [Tritonibacter litoralis]|uniref:AcvB/VirJ family lysyl-phosphatidylglycerol hydrolase n=1 Tax=Tritonibacter litoralis TaxID=2662264 RepID=UPI0018851C95
MGQQGWDHEVEQRAQRLSEMHTLVIGVTATGTLRQSDACEQFASELARIAETEQKNQNALARTPVLVGLQDGAALAISAAWAAPDRFKGLVTQAAPNRNGFCDTTHTPSSTKAPVRWLDIALPNTSPAQGLAGVTVVDPTDNPRKAFYQSYLRLAGTDSSFDIDTGAGADLRDLPLTVHENQNVAAQDVYAIFLSGDGGWAKFDEEISDRLADHGIPVVGISSLRYMWREKTPEQIAADFERIDAHFRRKFGRTKVMLLGFSLGANTVPFAARHLSQNMRERLLGVGLIAPETHTGFEIVVGGWLGQRTGAIEVAPAIQSLSAHLPPERILCLHGRKETVSACPVAQVPGMQRVVFDGGHHMGNDHDGVARQLVQLVKQHG